MNRDLQPLRTLMVDDDMCQLMLIENLLEREFGDRLAITLFDDARDAYQWLTQHDCDLLLSDLEMPGYDGFDLLRVAQDYNGWTQVVFMTAHSTWNRVESAVGLGAIDYLLKPVDPTAVRQAVAAACERHERWKAAMRGTMQHAGG